MVETLLTILLPLLFLGALVAREARWACATAAGAVLLHPAWIWLLVPLLLQELRLRWDPAEGAWLRRGDWMAALPLLALLG